MKLLIAALLLTTAACEPKTRAAKRDNRAIQFVSLINRDSACYAVYTAPQGTIDTAYCTLGDQVIWCEASELMPPKCQKIGQRQAEKPAPEGIAPPQKAAEK